MIQDLTRLRLRTVRSPLAAAAIYPPLATVIAIQYGPRLAALTAVAASCVLLTRLRYATQTAIAVMALPLVLRFLTHESVVSLLPLLLLVFPAVFAVLARRRRRPPTVVVR